MAKATFGMYWQNFGTVTIDLPDNVDASDIDAVEDYIDDHLDEIPIPSECSLVAYSKELADDTEIEIIDD
jgi:hypothetical protein